MNRTFSQVEFTHCSANLEAAQVREELRRFKLAMDNSADMMLTVDRTTMRYVDVNVTACELLGYSREELMGMGPQDLIPGSRSDFEKAYDDLIANPSLVGGMNSHYRRKDGSLLPFESTRRVLRSGDTWFIAAVSRDITNRLKAEQVLRESEARHRAMFEEAAVGITITGLEGALQTANPKFCDMLGYALGELVGLGIPDLTHAADVEQTLVARAHSRSGDKASYEREVRLLRKDGSAVWVHVATNSVRDAKGDPSYFISVVNDISGRKQADERIRRLNRVRAVLGGINAGIAHVHERDELFTKACNIAVEQGGFGIAQIFRVDEESGELWSGSSAGADRLPEMRASILPGATTVLEHGTTIRAIRTRKPAFVNDIGAEAACGRPCTEALQRGYGAAISLPFMVNGRVVAVLLLVAKETGFFDDQELALLRELSRHVSFALDSIKKRKRLNYLASFDHLTGLSNRSQLNKRIDRFLKGETPEAARVAMLVVDLERFRMVNETLGRAAGDELLKQIADRVRAVMPDAGWLARIGPDQFASILPDAVDPEAVLKRVENRLREILGAPFALGDAEVRMSAKVGIAMFPEDGPDAETLLRNAEAALRKAKMRGEHCLFYTKEMTAHAAEKLSLSNKLRDAVERDEFVLHYQPKVDSRSRRIAGVEALIRWHSPDFGLVQPAKFIPLMEETGLILHAGAWALNRASLDHRAWVESGLDAPRIAVNVSPIQLRERDFVDVVKRSVMNGTVPAGVDIEVTESLLMDDVRGNIEKLKALRALGLGIAIDDFGTGYSSLAYLAKLPVQTLKIDRSFIISMLEDADMMTLVRTIVSLAQSLRLTVVAEGVETQEQANILRLLGCDELQGYLFSKPVPFEQMTALLRQEQLDKRQAAAA